MNAKQFAAQMKAIVEDIKAKGVTALYCDNIIAYLDDVQNSPDSEPTPHDIERYKADLQISVEENKHQHESGLEMFRSVFTSGQNAVKSSLLLNGGGAVALLAFIGHLAQFEASKVPVFAACLLPFAFGVLTSTVTSGFTYFTQWFYAYPSVKAQRAGCVFNILSVLLAFTSYGLFTWGLLATYFAFVTYV